MKSSLFLILLLSGCIFFSNAYEKEGNGVLNLTSRPIHHLVESIKPGFVFNPAEPILIFIGGETNV